ncbi:MAG: alpha/beta hydrolase [Myxococcales bacterium]|nr:alpha/beta hydrolase [Myxococcales bacterium]
MTKLDSLPLAASFGRPHRFVDVGSSRIATYSFGSGPPVVLVHGWPLSGATFRHLIAELRGDFTCHVLDLPGAGQTETADLREVDLRVHAETVRAVVDALDLGSYALFGHDSGGFVARVVASQDPRVTGLALTNTEIPGHTPPLLTLYVLLAKVGLAGPAVRALVSSRLLRRSALGFGGCFTDAGWVDGEFAEIFLQPLVLSARACAGAVALLENADHSVFADLERVHAAIRVPVSLVWGAADPWFPIAKARAMLGQLGGPASLVEIEGGKLFVHEDRAAEVARAVAPFFARCFADRGAERAPTSASPRP